MQFDVRDGKPYNRAIFGCVIFFSGRSYAKFSMVFSYKINIEAMLHIFLVTLMAFGKTLLAKTVVV